MESKIYKTKENAKRGKRKIIETYPKWLKMEDNLYIVKYPDNTYHLQDYANRRLTDKERQEKYYEWV